MTNFLAPRDITDNSIDAAGILYFLTGGHFLFRWWNKEKWESKFVTINDVTAALANLESDSGWLGEGILRAGRSARGDWFVYSAPAQKVTITLTAGENPGSVTVPIPATVLIGVGHAYYLFAVKETTARPNSNIFRAPFPNLYEHGRICWGSNKPPKADHKHAKLVWSLFFNTPFNSHLSTNKSKAFSDDVTRQLRWLAANHTRKYPVEDLTWAKASLDAVVEQIMDRSWRE